MRFFSLLYLSAKRLRYHTGLSLLSLLGVILAVALVSSAAFFSQAVDTVIMRQELAEYTRVAGRPPFSSLVFAASSRPVPLTLERAETLGDHVADTLSAEVGLPIKTLDMMADSGAMALRPLSGDARYTGKKSFDNFGLAYYTNIEQHLDFVSGIALQQGAAGQSSAEAVDVWMHSEMAAKFGVQLGDRFDLANSQGTVTVPIVVQGIWQVRDQKDTFWFTEPNQTLRNKLLVRRNDYLAQVEPLLETKVRAATWFVTLDEGQASPARGREYVEGFQNAKGVIAQYLPGVQLTAPSISLNKFVGRQTTLTTLLLGFNTPAFGFLLYFLVLTSAVIAYWQRRETAILISRGMTRWGVLSFTLVEGLLLFLIASPIGLALGMALARGMGYTVSFLSFEDRIPLPVSLEGLNLPLLGITLLILLIAKLWTAAVTTGETVLSQEREHIRPPRGPFWYRAYLDVVLLIPAWYGYQQLIQEGALGQMVEDRPQDLYQDPLLIIAPSLFVVVAALLAMRLFPLLMRIFDRLATTTSWLTLHLALRQLGRYSHNYITPMLLVIVSLALGVYTLSMAASLDTWLVDRVYYRTGADLTFKPFSEIEAMSDVDQTGAEWVPPIDEFRDLPGAAAAARVGDYKAVISLAAGNGESFDARFMAVDRVDFPTVAWFRYDFARESLGALMNRLAGNEDGILIPLTFMQEHNLRVGERLKLFVLADFDATITSDFVIVGAYEYFPTAYEEPITVIGNLEYIFSFFNLTMPHNIWIRLQPETIGDTVIENVQPVTGVGAINVADVRESISHEQAQMERVGVFGTLSVGFVAAAFMAALGLLTYSYASLHERMFLFSVLRSIGLKRLQVVAQVALEYTILTLYGAVAAIFIGSYASVLFVPLFRVAGSGQSILPPLIPIIAQNQIAPLATLFVGLMIVLEMIIIAASLWQNIFVALRMGHQG